jgi:hypothetical protein
MADLDNTDDSPEDIPAVHDHAQIEIVAATDERPAVHIPAGGRKAWCSNLRSPHGCQGTDRIGLGDS